MYSFDVKKATPLCEIMGRNKSDKGSIDIQSSWHNYTTLYYSIFNDIKEKPLRVFELGLGTNNVNIPSNMGINGQPGASLYGWSEYFPNARIFGADIDKDILFNTETITTYYCDQTNPTIINAMWDTHKELQEGFDIIIDDGLHTFSANVCFFENSIHKLNSKGYYIIEDIQSNEVGQFAEKIKKWETKYNGYTFSLIHLPSTVNTWDNKMLIVHRNY